MDEIREIWPQWETDSLIGSGSYGRVYKAKKEQMGTVSYSAVKVIHIPQSDLEIRELQNSGMDASSIHSYYDEMVRNMMNEIQVLESLKSANNIVGIENYDVVAKEDGIGWKIFIRMELLTCLSAYIADNSFTESDVVQLGIDVLTALISCHQVNIIHRDIKIDNIFVNKFGAYKLGDFGIAKQLEKAQTLLSQKGTIMYMAPEVFKRETYDKTVDIYSLGIVMYRLLNGGRFPFMPPSGQDIKFNDDQEAMQRRLNGETVPKIAGVSDKLYQIIAKACEYNPNNRYQTAVQMKKELVEYQQNCLENGDGSKSNYVAIGSEQPTVPAYEPPTVPANAWPKTTGKKQSRKSSIKKNNMALFVVISVVAFVVALLSTLLILTNKDTGKQNSHQVESEFKVGSIITFGEYLQEDTTGDGRVDSMDEEQAIRWKILSYNEEKNEMLVISEKVLECKQYNHENENITWAESDLRRWLNEDFYEMAFNDEEKEAIQTKNIVTNDNNWTKSSGGSASVDKVFVLSIDEAINDSFGFMTNINDADEKKVCLATEYAIEQGVWISKEPESEGRCNWWLRSAGQTNKHGTHVGINGRVGVNGYEVAKANYGVRPALWLKFFNNGTVLW